MSRRNQDGPVDRDALDVMRFLDGEMHDVERTRFEQRLQGEPELAEALATARGGRDWFAAGRDEPIAPPEGLAASVMAQVRAEPAPDRSQPDAPVTAASTTGSVDAGAPSDGEARFVRQLLLAAVLLIGLAAGLFLGMKVQEDAERLEASPDRIRQEMERLDERIRDGALDPGSPEPGAPRGGVPAEGR